MPHQLGLAREGLAADPALVTFLVLVDADVICPEVLRGKEFQAEPALVGLLRVMFLHVCRERSLGSEDPRARVALERRGRFRSLSRSSLAFGQFVRQFNDFRRLPKRWFDLGGIGGLGFVVPSGLGRWSCRNLQVFLRGLLSSRLCERGQTVLPKPLFHGARC